VERLARDVFKPSDHSIYFAPSILSHPTELGKRAASVAFSASPVTTSTDLRWSLYTAMSFADGKGGDLTEYLPIIASGGTRAP
jgi:hypothetical protein